MTQRITQPGPQRRSEMEADAAARRTVRLFRIVWGIPGLVLFLAHKWINGVAMLGIPLFVIGVVSGKLQ